MLRRVAANRPHRARGEMVELETDRLLIREVLASDADDFLRYRHQEDYWRHVPIEPPTADSIAAMVSGWIQSQDQNPRTVSFFWRSPISVRINWWGMRASTSAAFVPGRARLDGASFQVTRVRALRPRLARRYCASHLRVSACTESLRNVASRIRRRAG
jgi:hypothetical protein